MSNDNISKILGDCLLQGWVMTDETCANEGCYVPLMRSGRNVVPPVTFCARCDGVPNHRASSPARQLSPNHSQSSRSEDTHASRSSTPITEPMSEISLLGENIQPVPVEEARRRREQSDQASAEIGSRLLKGWAMLADECPNDTCYGIPLVRPPSYVRGKDQRKECVVCGTVYVNEADETNQESSRSNSRKRPRTQQSEQEMTHTSSTSTQVKLSTAVPALVASANGLEDALRALSYKISSLTSDPNTFDTLELNNTVDVMDKVLQTLDTVRRLSASGSDGS